MGRGINGQPFTPEMITQGVGSGGVAFQPYMPSQGFYGAPKAVQDMIRAGQGPAGFKFPGAPYMGPPPSVPNQPAPPIQDSGAQWAQANRPAGWAPPQGAPGANPSSMTMTPKESWDARQASQPQMNHSSNYGGSGQGYEPPASNELNLALNPGYRPPNFNDWSNRRQNRWGNKSGLGDLAAGQKKTGKGAPAPSGNKGAVK
jgi:hypothetical protein